MYTKDDVIISRIRAMKTDDLNKSRIPHADKKDGEPLKNNNTTVGNISCYFRNLEDNLIKHISEADVVVGSVAWLTNEGILEAMKSCKHVSIVVQKEDFLRPDTNMTNTKLKILYRALPKHLNRFAFETILSKMSTNGDNSIEPVRCVGNNNRNKYTSLPRAHNKFLVFCKIEKRPYSEDEIQERIDRHLKDLEDIRRFESESTSKGINWRLEMAKISVAAFQQQTYYEVIRPYAFWTGSFNFTENACKSFENAIYIRDEILAQAYLKEYSQIAALSEPLNWETEWMSPEWRIGT